MNRSVVEAIQSGEWTYEPDHSQKQHFRATNAEPGSAEKLEILARRIQAGLPLWHPEDRQSTDLILFSDSESEEEISEHHFADIEELDAS